MVEIVAMAAAAAFATIVIWDGRSRRWEGFLLVGVYVLAASPCSSLAWTRRATP